MKLNRVGLGLPMLASVLLLASGAHAVEPNRVYDTNCAFCHQKAGVGLTGQFPRLAGRAAEIAATEAGRRYLVEVVLFGMAGKVEVDGAPLIGVMPAFATLSDDDLTSALNYITHLDGSSTNKGDDKKPQISTADVQSVRAGAQLSPMQVRTNREAVLVAKMK
jgi:mono/diheme cytochrome c family protein